MAAVVLFAVPAMAAISTTKHNLGAGGTGTVKTNGTSEICIFCHTPHQATSNKPLWNRNTASISSSYSSPTLDNTVDTAYLNSANSVAPLCLSCHDGSTGLGAGVVNTFDKTALPGWSQGITGAKAIGSDGISNDHPVGMIYNPANDLTPYGVPGLRTAVASNPGPSTGPLDKWFRTSGGNNYMDCSSCHDVHGKDGNPKFLRRSNASSNFCLTCHLK